MSTFARLVTLGSVVALLAGCSGGDTTDTVANDTAIVSNPAAQTTATPSPVATDSLVPAAENAPVLAIDGEGLRWIDPQSGRTRAIPYGITRTAALEALATLGEPTLGTNAECSMPYASYANGLTINFEDDKFAGWMLDSSRKPTLSTMSGVRIGSTLAEMREANDVKVEESSLGQEFLIGEVAGLLGGTSPTSKVTDLWSGVNCIAR